MLLHRVNLRFARGNSSIARLAATVLLGSTLAISGLSGCVKVPEAGLNQAVTQGLVSATVNSVELTHLDLEGPTGAMRTQEPVLRIGLQLTNNSAVPLRYDLGFSATTATQALSPLLFVDPGVDGELGPTGYIESVLLSTHQYLGDPIAAAVTVAPGQTIDDVLLFRAPPAGATSFVLSLPPSIFGPEVKTPALVRFAYTAPAVIPEPQPVAVGTPWVGPDYTFTVTGSQVQFVRLRNAENDEGFSQNPLLRVDYTLTNTGSATLQYIPVEASNAIAAPTLVDAAGLPIPRAEFQPGIAPVDQFVQRRQVAAGETISNYLLFQRPEQGTSDLTLFIAGKRFDSTGLVRVTMPFTWADPPQPAELTPVVVPAPGTVVPGAPAAPAAP
jgi:hypothetical protein